MENLKEEYNRIIKERKGIIDKINVLMKNEEVKQFLNLNKQNDKLVNQQKNLYNKIKIEEYSSCNHIWVNTLHDFDCWEGRSYDYYGCIKCGLDKRVFFLMENYHSLDCLTLEQRIMYDFMKSHPSCYGINSNIICDLDLAKAIYARIKEVHPNIDDEKAVKYLKVALHNIRFTKVSEERKESRAKRLSLKSEFKKWNIFDISR